MSVIIKGMELPKNGEMKDLTIGRAPNGSEFIAIAHGDTTEFYKVVEIPAPHGRLIDAEKLAVKIWTEGHFVNGNDCEIAVDFTQLAPTIIEAEVSE